MTRVVARPIFVVGSKLEVQIECMELMQRFPKIACARRVGEGGLEELKFS